MARIAARGLIECCERARRPRRGQRSRAGGRPRGAPRVAVRPRLALVARIPRGALIPPTLAPALQSPGGSRCGVYDRSNALTLRSASATRVYFKRGWRTRRKSALLGECE
jgi:hypothetical protein